MSSCADEAGGHGHSHDHHGHDHGHDGHDHDVPLEAGPSDSLYGVIDTEHVVALNAAGGGEQGRVVIKDWASREDETKWLESELDDSLILQIPFTASVALRSITLKAGHGGFCPSHMRVFANAPGLDFADAESKQPTQEFEVVQVREGAEYQVKAAKFASLTSLALHFPHNESEGDDEETTRVYYVGLRGSHRPLPGRLNASIVYEAAPRPTDHKLKQGDSLASTHRQGF
ncbi:PITH domain-containing protein [Vanrija pseudolonga]|uniref:PITH domain-containing protein n=1 Tax=Vanrija pseudolonga TaxID=143232 RepID=A0AAF1BJL6_9TREE|nr:PITH domain-containing protein [Vanrija pseudolonga]